MPRPREEHIPRVMENKVLRRKQYQDRQDYITTTVMMINSRRRD
jgi:hypothetical protein